MKRQAARLLYNRISLEYCGNRPTALNDYTELPTVMKLAGDVRNKRVLDAGCGPGKHAKRLIERGAKVTGIDVSEKMVNIAREHCNHRGNFFQADFSEVKFSRASFELIIASLSLMYSKNIDRVISNFSHWLKPEGRLIFSIYHPVRFFQKVKDFDFSKSRKIWIHLQGCDVTVFNYYYPLKDYFSSLVGNGFELLNYIEPVLSRRLKDWPEDNYRVPRTIVIESRKKKFQR